MTETQTDDKAGPGSPQPWGWLVIVASVAVGLGLVVYGLVAGLGAANQLASVIGAVVGVAGLVQGLHWVPHAWSPPTVTKKTMAAAAASLAAVVASIAAAIVLLHPFGHGPTPPTSPPGRTVYDDGRAFGQGGSSRFKVTIDPANTGVRVTRRLDAGIGMQTATITVNGARVGLWQPLSIEPVYRWKDQSIDIPPSLTAGRHSLNVTNTFVASAEDFNEFAYFISEKINGAWSTADILDVGPDHLPSEAAHHYRITHETFAGERAWSYPK